MSGITSFSRFLLVLVLTLVAPVAWAAPGVESFSPQGETATVQVVSAVFTTPMIAFGTQRQAAPFDIQCAEPGDGRWVDDRHWRYDFRRVVPGGIECAFRTRAGLRDLAGKALAPASFRVDSGGPWIVSMWPMDAHAQLAPDQVFTLSLNAPPTAESIRDHAWCEFAGTPGRVPLEVIKPDSREENDPRRIRVRCARTIAPETVPTLVWGANVASASGVKARREQRYAFFRGPSWIKYAFAPPGHSAVNPDQVFVLLLAADMDEAMLARELSCEIKRVAERIPVQLVKRAWDTEIARQYPSVKLTAEDRRRFVGFQCRRQLPDGAEITLHLRASTANFHVKPTFNAKIHCAREHAASDCSPVSPVELRFPARVPQEKQEKIRLVLPDGKAYKPTFDESSGGLTARFDGPFPELATLRFVLPEDLRDEWGRRLANAKAVSAPFKTADSPPMVIFPSDFGIIESASGGLLPVTVRNLEPAPGDGGGVSGAKLRRLPLTSDEDILNWMLRPAAKSAPWREWSSQRKPVLATLPGVRESLLPKPNGPRAWEIVGIPLEQHGLQAVEVESARLGALLDNDGPMYVRTLALNTDLAVHFKHGRDSSLVWVTTLDSAEPVGGASVAVRDCAGGLLWEGTTSKYGAVRIRKALPSPTDWCAYSTGYFVSARKGDDVSFAFSAWQKGIEPWRYGLFLGIQESPVAIHTVFDRSLLRAGETLHMKHIARRKTTAGFAIPDPATLPKKLFIEQVGSDRRNEVRLKWDANGVAETTWKIPKEAKLGDYRVWAATDPVTDNRLNLYRGEEGEEDSGDTGAASGEAVFRVAEFRLPVMKGDVTPPATIPVAPGTLPVNLQLSYLSGGPAGGQTVRLRAILAPHSLYFRTHPEVPFSATPAEKAPQPLSQAQTELANGERVFFDRKAIRLDAHGAARVTIADIPAIRQPMDMQMEMEFLDPSGEINTIARTVTLWPATLLVGIKADGWMAAGDKLAFTVVVLGTDGKPKPEVEVKVDGEKVVTRSHRRRLTGGFYGYEHTEERTPLAALCTGRTDIKGELRCELATPEAGELRLDATVGDAAGRRIVANASVWVSGDGESWFPQGDHDRIDLLADKQDYQPGDKARFQVRMPFREATALITVEREGIIDTYVQHLSGKAPVVEVPIKSYYAPNAYVSVLVVRGRVNDIEPGTTVDLGRPAYKLGIAEVRVGWSGHRLKVDVKPERATYRARDTAKVRIAVRDSAGRIPPKGAEVALAAVDEALLELAPNRSWDLLTDMMRRRGYHMETATAQSQVVGKRHYGRKALPAGGGGGRQPTRELFDTLLAWQARLPLDANGEALAEIPLNDTLGSFRIVAVATAGAGRFGTGQASIATTRELQIISGLPTLVREGDRYRAGFTLRNTSEHAMRVAVTARMTVTPTPNGQPGAGLSPQEIDLPAGAAREVAWTVTLPQEGRKVTWELEARETGGDASDRLKFVQDLKPLIPLQVQQAYLAQLESGKPLTMSVRQPADALPGKGGIRVLLSPTLGGSLTSIREFMQDYPYTCLEQKTSRAIALHDETLWQQIVQALPSYLDRDGLAKYFPDADHGSVALTAYLLAVSHEAGRELPEGARSRMLAALEAFIEGRLTDAHHAPRPDRDAMKLLALEAYARYQPIQPCWLDSLAFIPERAPTGALLDWISILARSPALPRRDALLDAAERNLRGRLAYSGTKLTFVNERDDYWWWLMVSDDSNAVRAVLDLLDRPAWKQELPRLVRGALERQRGGHWNTTVGNVWGSLMLEKYRRAFEATPPTGTTTATLGDAARRYAWGKGGAVTLPWSAAKLTVDHQGEGKPYATVQSLAAIPVKNEVYAGYRIAKTITPVEQKTPGEWRRGDVLRVTLEVTASAERTWVVIHDPIPAGATILGRGLARDSTIARMGQEQSTSEDGGPNFEEHGYDAYNAYYEYLPGGKVRLQYTLRLNNEGEFKLPPTRVEAMYSPELFGEKANAPVSVKP